MTLILRNRASLLRSQRHRVCIAIARQPGRSDLRRLLSALTARLAGLQAIAIRVAS